jgi:hypothetical protein
VKAFSRGWRKGARSLVQVAAAGGLTLFVTAIAHGLTATQEGLVMGAWLGVVAFLHNYLETAGMIPVLLPTSGLVSSATTGASDAVLAPVVGAVEATADDAGKVTGTVTDVAGGVVGTVTGLLEPEGKP